MLETLPDAPPAGVEGANAYAVAHGFFCRVARTSEGALLLVDSGLGSEAAPLRRAALEHLLGLAWVIDEGMRRPRACSGLTRIG